MNYVLGSQHCRHSGKTHTKTYGPFEENINIQRWEFLTLFIVFVSFFFLFIIFGNFNIMMVFSTKKVFQVTSGFCNWRPNSIIAVGNFNFVLFDCAVCSLNSQLIVSSLKKQNTRKH